MDRSPLGPFPAPESANAFHVQGTNAGCNCLCRPPLAIGQKGEHTCHQPGTGLPHGIAGIGMKPGGAKKGVGQHYCFFAAVASWLFNPATRPSSTRVAMAVIANKAMVVSRSC